ncbi:hypothetical protein AKJ16_DCAP20734 [Drosera capensis]
MAADHELLHGATLSWWTNTSHTTGGVGVFVGGWATAAAVMFILILHCAKHLFSLLHRTRSAAAGSSPTTTTDSVMVSSSSTSSSSEIITEADLRKLIACLDGEVDPDEKWEDVIEKRNNSISYKAKCCTPKNGSVKYLSSTVFENCSPDVLKEFYMDNDFRKQWDNTFLEHEQLRVDVPTGIEIGRIIKRFPLLRLREYVMAWKLWQGNNQIFYCIVKECEDPLAPRQRKYVRVETFRSGWRIRKVPGTNACEINMVHQEDAGLNEKMAKLVFSKGIWSYVCKMDSALRKYSLTGGSRSGSSATAVTLVQKVPSELEVGAASSSNPPIAAASADHGRTEAQKEDNAKKLTRKPSKKLLTKSLLLVGGLICLTYGHPSLGAQVAVAYVLKKLSKRGAAACGRNQD